MWGLFHSRALTGLLLAMVLAGRLMVPTGWMPLASEGGIAIVLCSSDGPAPAWLDAAGKLHKGKQDSGDNKAAESCPFAALSTPANLTGGPILIAPMAPVDLPVGSTSRAVAIGGGLAAPPPPATGPPHSA
jgi:hypothetical protein